MQEQDLKRRAGEAAHERLLQMLLPAGSSTEVRERFRKLLQSGAMAQRRLTVATSDSNREQALTVREMIERFTSQEYEKLTAGSGADDASD